MARQVRATVYDMLDAQGIFATNPANVQSVTSEGTPLYRGPVAYPRMVYHPQGLTKVVEQGEILVTPLGPKEVNRRVELVSKLVASKEDELLARQEGWHLHPGDAVEASGGAKAIKSPQEVLEERNREVEEKAAKADTAIADAERRIAELEAQLAALAQPAGGGGLGSGATAKVR